MTEFKITLPKITLPSFNITSISPQTWLIVIFVLVMLLFSCMSTRPRLDTFRSRIERFKDEGNLIDTLDAGQELAPKPSYSCSLQTRCLPGERDVGNLCLKEGCPEGTQQGVGLGNQFCYPKCILGYESDGASRCFKKCPEGWETQGDRCIRPTQEMKKDVVPSKITPPPVDKIIVEPIVKSHKTVIMTPTSSAYILPTYGISSVTYPTEDNTLTTTTEVDLVGGSLVMEPFESKNAVWQVESVEELPCPLGYTLSGDMCYENCPPHYRDTGDGCVLDSYSVERPSYDRGSGIPYASKRSKNLKVNPIDRNCP